MLHYLTITKNSRKWMERWGKQYHLTFRKLKFTKNLTILSITWPIFTTHLCGKVMFSVMSVCVCVSVCPSVQNITFEPLHIETSFLVYRYIFAMSGSSLSIKVIGSGSRSCEKNDNFTYFNMLILCMWLRVINEVRVTNQGEGHIKVKVKYLLPF